MALRYHGDMLATHPPRTHWIPKDDTEREQVRLELEAVLSSPYFCNSKRYPALLRYLVEHTLQGDTGRIKERTLGIEVFGRSASYDTNSDTVVRYTAGEVRRRLALYYHDHEDVAVQIGLPVGSYVPEFLHLSDEPATALSEDAHATIVEAHPAIETVPEAGAPTSSSPVTAALPGRFPVALLALAAMLLLVIAASIVWSLRLRDAPDAALDRFWHPVAHGTRPPLIVTGGNIFANNGYSGTQTATRATDYPFVSMQIAAAMARVSGLLQREGSTVDIQAASTTMLNDLRDRPIILLGGYNNEWTMRLISGLPYHLGPSAAPSILEGNNPQPRWQRDRNLPYGAADDYALVGRFRDSTSGSMMVLMAGIGRNGSEAAAQFLTNAQYMRQVESFLGHRIDERNLEVVLHIRVIDGRTGAPSILAVKSW